MPVCPICKKSVPQLKINSHVMPEWMYKESEVYEEKGRAIALNLQNNQRPASFIQQGYRGNFMCENCEQKTAKLDSYASLIFKDENDLTCLRKEQQQISNFLVWQWHWSGFDFKQVQNFVFSICLRQHFYNLSKKRKSELIIEKHLKLLLSLYNSDDIDDGSYPISIHYFPKDEKQYGVILPDNYKRRGHHFIQFIACGLEFSVKISSHIGTFDKVKELRMKSNGSISMLPRNPEDSGPIQRIRNKFRRTPSFIPDINKRIAPYSLNK